MNFVDDTSIRALAGNILKQIGGKIMKGQIKNIMSISKPAPLLISRGLQELCSDDHLYTDLLYEAALEQNPITRMNLVISHIIAGFHVPYS